MKPLLASVADRVRRTMSVLLAVLREIFDESAYARFLARSHTPSSKTAYAAFLEEHTSAQAHRHRCC